MAYFKHAVLSETGNARGRLGKGEAARVNKRELVRSVEGALPAQNPCRGGRGETQFLDG